MNDLEKDDNIQPQPGLEQPKPGDKEETVKQPPAVDTPKVPDSDAEGMKHGD